MGAGSVIMGIGMTTVFVPQDLEFMGLTAVDLNAINPRLVPLIAHDRAGFGGGLVSCGMLLTLIVWKARITPALWQAFFVAGSVGFACALGVHFLISYIDLLHIAPAVLGAAIFTIGLTLTYTSSRAGRRRGGG